MAKGINLTGTTVSARDDGFIYNVISGKSGLFDYGKNMAQQMVTNNLIKISDGIAQLQGRNFIVYPGEIVDINIENGTQAKKRNDLIVLEFSNITQEIISFKVLKGEPTDGVPTDQILIQQDTLNSGNVFQLPLYRVRLDGLAIDKIEDMRTYIPKLSNTVQITNETEDYLEVEFSIERR